VPQYHRKEDYKKLPDSLKPGRVGNLFYRCPPNLITQYLLNFDSFPTASLGMHS